jgi:glycosyltransferase involved in cell wall biosynthesis
MTLPDVSDVDVTVVLLTYNRPECLEAQLDKLSIQTYSGSWELIIWNNNPAIDSTIETAIRHFSVEHSVTRITATTNYMGQARFAAAELARGNLFMSCDDDIVPGPEFLARFVQAYHRDGPRVVVCGGGERIARGKSWYVGLSDPECDVQYAHANCLLTSTALFREAARMPMSTRQHIFIDDLWMSHVWHAILGVRLLKIQCDAVEHPAARAPTAMQYMRPVRALRELFISQNRLTFEKRRGPRGGQ